MAEKILVVDDDLDSLKLIGLMLQRQGYGVSEAANGATSLEKARVEQPDLIILDVMMPDMDGYEVARQLRANPVTAHIPIIMFTAKTMVDDKVAGFEAGADDYLTKPTHPSELAARVKSVLARSAARQVAIPGTAPLPAARRGNLIAFIGAKGGAGTTTLAINGAVAIAEMLSESKVILGEIRPGQGTIGLLMGLMRAEGLARLLAQGPGGYTAQMLKDALVVHESGLQMLLSPIQPTPYDDNLTPDVAEGLVRGLAALAAFTVLDLGSGLDPRNRRLVTQADQVVVVVEPQRVSMMLAHRMLEELKLLNVGVTKIGAVLVNRVPSAMSVSFQSTQEQLGSELLSVISAAPELAYQAAESGTPLIQLQPNSLPAGQIRKLVQELLERLGTKVESPRPS